MRAFSLALLICWISMFSAGCKKYYNLNYRTSIDLNATANTPGQPVLVGLYPLTGLPEGLTTATCPSFTTDELTREFLKDVLAYDVTPVSFTPNERSVARLPRVKGARWLLVVPFFEDKCTRRGDQWALLRVWPSTRSRSVTMSSYQIVLPWDKRPWRQRGCVDGQGHHVSWSVCE